MDGEMGDHGKKITSEKKTKITSTNFTKCKKEFFTTAHYSSEPIH